jgi:hypothetical protein
MACTMKFVLKCRFSPHCLSSLKGLQCCDDLKRQLYRTSGLAAAVGPILVSIIKV